MKSTILCESTVVTYLTIELYTLCVLFQTATHTHAYSALTIIMIEENI